MDIVNNTASFLSSEQFLKAVMLWGIGFVLAKVLSRSVLHLGKNKLSSHAIILLRRGIFWGVFVLFFVTGLNQLGFKLGVLMGAAGVLTVAIGFASQTSVSNLISGLFVLGERSFSIGDVIQVGTTTGEVLSVDLLSVKLRTFDNLFIRIPNEQLIKSEVTTITKFPIRRFDCIVGVAYDSDIKKVQEVLLQVATDSILCLDEPPPLFIIRGFSASSIDIQFSVWATRENFLEMKNTLHRNIKSAFDSAGIEIPFPHVSLHQPDNSKPISIQLSGDDSLPK